MDNGVQSQLEVLFEACQQLNQARYIAVSAGSGMSWRALHLGTHFVVMDPGSSIGGGLPLVWV